VVAVLAADVVTAVVAADAATVVIAAIRVGNYANPGENPRYN
jgi:hypothetical protein